MEFSEKLRFLRGRAAETQEETAEACGIARHSYARYEIGERYPAAKILPQIAAHFGVTVEALTNDDLSLDELQARASEPEPAQIDPHTYYAAKFGPETQAIIDELLAKLQAMPEDKREEAARAALTFARGLENEGKGKR